MSTIKIQEEPHVLTVISTFTVKPADQHDLLALLATNAERWLRLQPGFIGASLHASADGAKVINYAQWKDADALQTALRDPGCRDHVAAVQKVATVDAVRCAVTTVIEGERP
jgi:quinol monooxygenase YgiN